jgi:hypothetical protein
MCASIRRDFLLFFVYLKIVLENDEIDYTMQWTIKQISLIISSHCSFLIQPSKSNFPKLVAFFLLLSAQNRITSKFCSVALHTVHGMKGRSGCFRLQETWRKVGLHSLTLSRLKSTSTKSFSLQPGEQRYFDKTAGKGGEKKQT